MEKWVRRFSGRYTRTSATCRRTFGGALSCLSCLTRTMRPTPNWARNTSPATCKANSPNCRPSNRISRPKISWPSCRRCLRCLSCRSSVTRTPTSRRTTPSSIPTSWWTRFRSVAFYSINSLCFGTLIEVNCEIVRIFHEKFNWKLIWNYIAGLKWP